VSASAFFLGDGTNATGAVAVAPMTNMDLSSTTVSEFGLQTPHASGISIGSAINNTGRAVKLVADAMNIGAAVNADYIEISPSNFGINVDLGAASMVPSTFLLDSAEFGMLHAARSLRISTGATINVNGSAATSTPGDIFLSGGSVNVNGGGFLTTSSGSIHICCGDTTVAGAVTANSGSITLNVNNPVIGGPVTTTGAGHDINVYPSSSVPIELGGMGSVYLNNAEIDQFRPASGVLRIGELSSTTDISIAGPISNTGAQGLTTLSLVTGHGGVSQPPGTGAAISVQNLAAHARDAVTLVGDNSIPTISLQSTDSSVSHTHAGSGTLTVGEVDPAHVDAGITGANVTLKTDLLDINSPIRAGDTVIVPFTAGRPIAIGSQPAGSLGLTDAQLNSIFTGRLTLGDTSSGSATVTGAVNASSFSELVVNTGSGASINVDNQLGVPVITLNTGILNVNALLSGSPITGIADSMAFAAFLQAGTGEIRLRPRTPGTVLSMGGADAPGILGLSGSDLARLLGGIKTFGSSTAGDVRVDASTTISAFRTALITGGQLSFNQPFSANGALDLVADAMTVSPGGSVAATDSITISTNTAGRPITLGTKPGGTLGLNPTELGRISTGSNRTLEFFAPQGTITTTASLSFSRIFELALLGRSLDVSGGPLSAPKIVLFGDDMTIGSTVTAAGGGRINVAPLNPLPMDLGTKSVAGALGLSATEINNFITAGTLQLGNVVTASSIDISQAIAPTGASTLALVAQGPVSQHAGATITVPSLRIDAAGEISLGEANVVGTLAGGNSGGSYTFTSAGLLAVGPTVDGASGVQGGTLVLRADDIALAGPGIIGNSNVTLAPRTAGAVMNLGSSPGGVFGVDADELMRISGNTLGFGISAAGSNPTGSVLVSAPMHRTGPFQTLGISAGGTQTVDVNGELSSPFGVQIDAGTINVSQPITSSSGSVNLTARAPTTLNINAPITAASSVALNSDMANITAPVTVTQNGGAVVIAPVTTGRPTSLGSETAGALSLTQEELAFISTSSLTIGGSSIFSPTSGPMTIGAPLDLNVSALNLTSTGAITQAFEAPIRLTRNDPNGQRIGNLDMRSTGSGNGNASIFMPAANEVPGILSFATQGTNNDFDFVNALPMKLQSVVNSGVSGKVRLSIGLLVPLSPAPVGPVVTVPPSLLDGQTLFFLQAQLLTAIDRIADINEALPAIGEEDREKTEEEKMQQESR
jgi:hypothetical protein